MNYTFDQIKQAFENITPLYKRAMYYIDVNKKIEEIISSFDLEEYQKNALIEYINYILIGLMKYDDLENILIGSTSVDRNIAHKISDRVQNEIIKPLEERVQIENQTDSRIRDLSRIKNDEPPIPPYKKTETEQKIKEEITPKTKEEVFYEKNGIEFVKQKEEIKDEIILSKKDENTSFEESGIDVVDEKIDDTEIFVPESEKNMMEGIEHPESISNGILGNKLKETYGPKIIETNYSIPKVNDNLNKSQ